ncbi:bL21 family ribosomal protein [Ferrimonas lipolytica]|uniref:BL21 family ribosomal protein n=1 Tax=Ferrimonas lipolytica TaxID=2724191 RepID=A0A6H1UDF8_9GAMM|nr:bL21 family ribosomal protein [Ferrimonas lipolytica]QIZ77111.1 bL21 family ribosomal protein [Ferrimonas lipolytica]
MNSDPDKMLKQHQQLIHSENQKVSSHTQRENGDWFVNTLMIEGHSVPFKYKRKKQYRSLQGARINLTYYVSTENVAGFEIEVMNVVRIKRS